MKLAHHSILIGIIFFYALTSWAQSDPKEVVRQFYNWRIKVAFSGVPSQKELNQAQPFLSRELACLLDQARQYRDLFIKKYPDDKPPFIEGDMFSSLFEGPNRYELKKIKQTHQQTTVVVQFFYDQPKQPDMKGWQDHIILTQDKHQWLINDIRYNGHFDFGNSGSLGHNLRDVLSKNDLPLGWHGKVQLRRCR